MEKISSFMPRLMEEVSKPSLFKESLVFWAYRRSAGEIISNKIKPVRFSNGALYLQAEEKRWEQVLKDDEQFEQLINALNRELQQNVVHRIRFTKSPDN